MSRFWSMIYFSREYFGIVKEFEVNFLEFSGVIIFSEITFTNNQQVLLRIYKISKSHDATITSSITNR